MFALFIVFKHALVGHFGLSPGAYTAFSVAGVATEVTSVLVAVRVGNAGEYFDLFRECYNPG